MRAHYGVWADDVFDPARRRPAPGSEDDNTVEHVFATREGAQDAHEAIRPTSLANAPEKMRSFLDKDQLALYELIWRRFIASQMAPAKLQQVAVEIAISEFPPGPLTTAP